jgi:predicted HicB family RNase H-like nuclease
VVDDKEIVAFNVRLPREVWKLAKFHDIENNESMNALIVRLLTEYFQSQGKLPTE